MSDSPSHHDETDAGLFKRGGKRDSGPSPAPPAAAKNPSGLALAEYNMNHPKRGHCIIINQVEFQTRTGQSDRVGSDVDASSLEQSFKRLGFSVLALRNLPCGNITASLKEIAEKDHRNCDCLVVVMLSHGEDGNYVYGTDGKIRLEELTRLFRPDCCPSLAGKPKLFFIQACRGAKYDRGVEVADGDSEDQTDAGNLSRIPLESDYLYFYSTPPGYYSWRNDVNGSWFVRQLCRVLDEQGDSAELSHILLLVQASVSAEYQSNTNEENTSGMKQIPVSVSSLRKKLYFRLKCTV